MEFRNHMLIWEISGVFFIFFAGSALHFAYQWCGRRKSSALVAAVNESTWEHLKIAFWPALVFSAAEYMFISPVPGNFVFGKAVGLALIPLTIIIVFYSYTYILGRHYLVADIGLFFLAAAVGQTVSCMIISMPALPGGLRFVGICLLTAMLMAFSLLTYFPPRFFLFKDPVDGGYGIKK